MNLKEQIRSDLTASLKKGDSVRSLTLRLVLSALTNKEKEGKGELAEEDVLSIVEKEAKKRRESAVAFEKGGRPELAEKEKQELQILLAYLPEQLSREEVKKMVVEAVAEIQAVGMKDMGKVMALLAPKIKGRADGALVSAFVKELLQ